MNKETEAAKGKSPIWIYIILILAIAIIGSIIYRSHIESNATGVQKNEQPAPVAEAAIQEAEPCTTAEPEIVCAKQKIFQYNVLSALWYCAGIITTSRAGGLHKPP